MNTTSKTARPSSAISAVPRSFLHRSRIVAWAGILLALQALLLLFLSLWHNNVFGSVTPPISTDFVSFYAAGKLALSGTPALAYDRTAHFAAEIAARVPGIPYQFFFYPPVYLLLCTPIAVLPYMPAFLVFQAITLTLWLLVMQRILRSQGWTWMMPALAYPAVFWTLGLGQNAFVTAALLGGSTLLLDRRPILAGLCLGLLCYKPHLGLLAPIALAAGGHWRAFASAALVVLGLVILSAALFGIGTWQAYLTALAGSPAVYDQGDVDLAGFVTPYGAVRLLGAGSRTAALLQAAATLMTAAATAWIWRCDPHPAPRGMALAAGALLSVPLALVYDLMLLTIAMAWLVRGAGPGRLRAAEKLLLLLCVLVPLTSRELAHHLGVPIAPLAPAGLMLAAVTRSRLPARTALAGAAPAQVAARSRL